MRVSVRMRMRIRRIAIGIWRKIESWVRMVALVRRLARDRTHLSCDHTKKVGKRLSLKSLLLHHSFEHLVEFHSLFSYLGVLIALLGHIFTILTLFFVDST